MPGDRLYLLWSGWEGADNVAQHIYIAPMKDPLTIGGPRVRISSPEHDWERRGTPHVNEAPQALRRDERLFVIYSASGSWTDDYCLGQLAWTGGDVLDPRSWEKARAPVFSRTDEVFGPGHCSFAKSRDGREDWIFFHAAKRRGAGWDRRIHMQRFTWRADGTPDFGRPAPAGSPLPAPN
jgi:GH43 family beta-xylosidase